MSVLSGKKTDLLLLSNDALQFITALHKRFEGRRVQLLGAREARQREFDAGALPDFLEETRFIREDQSWKCAALAPGLEDRRVEITGPTDRKMVINALNSEVSTYMADFEGSFTVSNLPQE